MLFSIYDFYVRVIYFEFWGLRLLKLVDLFEVRCVIGKLEVDNYYGFMLENFDYEDKFFVFF